MAGRRKNHEFDPDSPKGPLVSAAETRALNLLPGHEDDPEQWTRTLARYGVEAPSGDFDITELIIGRTVVGRPEKTTLGLINETLRDMAEQVARESPGAGPPMANYFIEYPHPHGDNKTEAQLLTFDANGVTVYFVIEVDGTILVTRREQKDPRAGEVLKLSPHTRLTASVRAREPAGGQLVIENEQPPNAEESLMEELRDAVADYEAQYPR